MILLNTFLYLIVSIGQEIELLPINHIKEKKDSIYK